MRYLPTARAGLALTLTALLLTASAIYAGYRAFNVEVAGAVALSVSVEDPIEVYLVSGDATLLLTGDDTVDFGTARVDFWGTVTTTAREFEVWNTSFSWEEVTVSGDMADGVLPVYGSTVEALRPWPENAFRLAPMGQTGDSARGWVGLRFLDRTPGEKRTTVIFRAVEIQGPDAPSLGTRIDFEDPELGELCRFDHAIPLRDEYLETHGVSFSGDAQEDGLAVLHRCSNLGPGSHSTGDYFLAGNERATLSNGGIPRLPITIAFSHDVTEVSLWAAQGVKSQPFTLSIRGYNGPNATGDEVVTASQATTFTWQRWTLAAPTGKTIKSVVVAKSTEGHSLVIDDLEWKWAPQTSVEGTTLESAH